MSAKNLILFTLIIPFILAGCIPNSQLAPGTEPNFDNPLLKQIGGVGELKEVFNQDSGKIRLVLLLAPT